MECARPANVDQLLEQAGWIRALAHQLVRDAAAADDLVQETLLAALRHRPDASKPLRPWLARVARNQAALAARGERRKSEREHSAARTEALPSAADLAARAEQQKRLVEVVLELREPYRSVVLLRYYEGLAPEAIAARQGIPSSTVRNQLVRALAQLRERLDEHHRGNRREWCLALVPLAAQAKTPVASAGFVSTIVAGLLAMHVVTKFVLAFCVLVLMSTLAFFACQPRAARPELVAAPPERELEPPPLVFERQEHESVPEAAPAVRVATPEAVRESSRAPVNTVGALLLGKVVAKSGRAALADYEFVVDDGKREPETLVTDELGSFESVRDYETGELTITLLDRKGTESLTFVDGGLSRAWPPTEVRVAWQPKHELVLEADSGPTVSIRGLGAKADQNCVVALYDGPPCFANDTVTCERAPLRDGKLPWVRFGAQAMKPSTGRLPAALGRLVVTSGDGLQAGSVDVLGEQVATVDLKPTARLEIELGRKDRDALESAEVEVRSLETGCVWRADASWNGSVITSYEHAHRFSFGGLDPGEYAVTARCDGFAPAATNVRAYGGKVAHVELSLVQALGEGFVRGRLRSASGMFDAPVTVTLTPIAQRKATPSIQVCGFQFDGSEYVGGFEFGHLAPGAYAIQLRTNGRGHPRWRPATQIISVPVEGLEFTCLDEERTIDVRLSAIDSTTEGRLASARWQYFVDGVEYTAVGPQIVIEGVSSQSSLEWCVTARGFTVACGGWQELSPAGRGFFGEARIRRGWGAKLRAVDEASRVPLADVEITLDGELAGRTGEHGTLLVERTRPPRLIETKLDGWRPIDGMRKLGVVVDDDVRSVFVLPMRRAR